MSEQQQIERMRDVISRTGLSRSTIYAMLGKNLFITPVRISSRCIGFKKSDLEHWLNTRPDARQAPNSEKPQ
jgi:prophage regulatory protein